MAQIVDLYTIVKVLFAMGNNFKLFMNGELIACLWWQGMDCKEVYPEMIGKFPLNWFTVKERGGQEKPLDLHEIMKYRYIVSSPDISGTDKRFKCTSRGYILTNDLRDLDGLNLDYVKIYDVYQNKYLD